LGIFTLRSEDLGLHGALARALRDFTTKPDFHRQKENGKMDDIFEEDTMT
jgi:hypothetical protein